MLAGPERNARDNLAVVLPQKVVGALTLWGIRAADENLPQVSIELPLVLDGNSVALVLVVLRETIRHCFNGKVVARR
jgi:hypothetical protein